MENEVKEPAPKYNYISPEEYLAQERTAEYKHEYYYGEVMAMAGASLRHNIIDGNLMRTIGSFLKDKKCRMLPGNMRVSTPSHDIYMYPDASIVCGDPVLEDEQFDTLLNPIVIFEILSPSTRSIDKGRKFFFYQQIPSLREYFMIDSLKKVVHAGRKQSDGSWKLETIQDNVPSIFIESINFQLLFELLYLDTDL
jgi:Uma2 family endonuclease